MLGATWLVVGRPIRDAADPLRRCRSAGSRARERTRALWETARNVRLSFSDLQPVREAIRAHGARLDRVIVEASREGASPQLDAVARFAADHGAKVERRPRIGARPARRAAGAIKA